jgi:hypothetical protein
VATQQRSQSTVIDKEPFSPVTGESDRGFSDTLEDEGAGSSRTAGSSEYSPVSDAEQEQPEVKSEVKTEVEPEVLCMAQTIQALAEPQQESQLIRCPEHSSLRQSDTSKTEVGIVTEAHRQYDTALYKRCKQGEWW